MARSLLYNVAAVSFVIDGVAASDFASEFAVRVVTPDNGSTMSVGTDKASTAIGSNATCTIEVSYKPTSNSNDVILQLWFNQVNGRGKLFTCSADTGVNEQLSFNRCSVKKPSDLEFGGQEISPRTFMLNCEQFNPDKNLFPG